MWVSLKKKRHGVNFTFSLNFVFICLKQSNLEANFYLPTKQNTEILLAQTLNFKLQISIAIYGQRAVFRTHTVS